MSLTAYVTEFFHRYGDKPAIIDGVSGRTLTFRELERGIDLAAGGLVSLGIGPGDVCAIHSRNCIEYPLLFHAVARAGATVTTVSPTYSKGALRNQLLDSGARIVFTSTEFLKTVEAAAAEKTDVEQIVTIEESADHTSLGSLMRLSLQAPFVGVNPDCDVVALPYSSGTTGDSKGVMLTHRNIIANMEQVQAVERLSPDETIIGPLPLHHIYGLVVVMNLPLRLGATVVILPHFEIGSFLEAIQRYRATTAFVVPPMVRALAANPVVSSFDVSSLREVFSGAAPLPVSIARECEARIGCKVRQSYGMTEASPALFIVPRGTERHGSVGLPLPGTDFKIADPATGCSLPPHTLGEVCVRGPQVMKGYLNAPEATSKVIDEQGWLHTGDIGEVDNDGFLYVSERAKDPVKFRSLHYSDLDLVTAAIEDISSRRQASGRIRFQSLLLDSVRESVIAGDKEGRVTFWNRGAETLFGYSSEKAMGALFRSLAYPSGQRAIELRLTSSRGERRVSRHSQVLRRREDGSEIWTDVFVSTITDEAGNHAGWVAIHRDITELRRNEQLLRESREQLRNLTSSLMDVRESERTSLARELHDHLGQMLTRLKIDLCWLTEQTPRRLRNGRVTGMTTLIDQMVETVRHISAELRPPILDDLGLESAIEWQVREFAKWNHCRCRADVSLAQIPPDRMRDTAVFRVIQEALTNIARHAQARDVTIRATTSLKRLSVRIADDGVGLPDGTSRMSLGLIGMRERVESLGGKLDIRRGKRKGTIVSFYIPIAPVYQLSKDFRYDSASYRGRSSDRP